MDVSEAWGMATKRGQKTQGDWVKTHDLPHGGTQGPKVLIIAMFACRSLLIHTQCGPYPTTYGFEDYFGP